MQQHSVFRLGLFLAIAVTRVQSYTYWVDDSCTDEDNDSLNPETIEEAINMHLRANQRLSANPIDNNQDVAFQMLFKVDTTDAATVAEVKRVTSGVSEFVLVTGDSARAASDLRIYCDEDPTPDEHGDTARWQPLPDIPNLPEGVVPNSQKTYGVDQEMYDPLNGIRAPFGLNKKVGCQKDGVQAETFVNRYKGDTSGQNPSRTTMTICQVAIEDEVIQGLFDLPKNVDIRNQATNDPPGTIMNDFDALTSFIIAHEFTHHRYFDKEDVHGYPGSYFWDNVANAATMNAADSLNNAENYAYFAFIALLADRKWILGPNDDGVSEGPSSAQQGILVRNPTYQKAKRADVDVALEERFMSSAPLGRRFALRKAAWGAM